MDSNITIAINNDIKVKMPTKISIEQYLIQTNTLPSFCSTQANRSIFRHLTSHREIYCSYRGVPPLLIRRYFPLEIESIIEFLYFRCLRMRSECLKSLAIAMKRIDSDRELWDILLYWIRT